MNYQLQHYGVSDILDFEEKFILGEKEQWLQIANGSKHLDKIPKLKQTIEALKLDGTFDRIMDEFHQPGWRNINQSALSDD
ncbi:hypothetical protein [Vibrio sp. SCSIO 43136]|uniref:hypothetical protein n=1 Tax=Vibrio sp. SCSIO 43136 TaxID=2819101 RepID=UPI00207559C7|nr:hypothetical protein [Vibrio sp. SCSIO 43136]USD67464.1 hypothetical protein J4N39_22825 [Vibrio sp. SCSIO 43136]